VCMQKCVYAKSVCVRVCEICMWVYSQRVCVRIAMRVSVHRVCGKCVSVYVCRQDVGHVRHVSSVEGTGGASIVTHFKDICKRVTNSTHVTTSTNERCPLL